jgi:hypothetical protein
MPAILLLVWLQYVGYNAAAREHNPNVNYRGQMTIVSASYHGQGKAPQFPYP